MVPTKFFYRRNIICEPGIAIVDPLSRTHLILDQHAKTIWRV